MMLNFLRKWWVGILIVIGVAIAFGVNMYSLYKDRATTTVKGPQVDTTSIKLDSAPMIVIEPVCWPEGRGMCSTDSRVIDFDSVGKVSSMNVGKTTVCSKDPSNALILDIPREFKRVESHALGSDNRCYVLEIFRE